ncbi:MAG: DNA recombination protein RmuC [Clostridia bacterium]|nr:DNA recombination protein RmuC [Clostridia bacterium]
MEPLLIANIALSVLALLGVTVLLLRKPSKTENTVDQAKMQELGEKIDKLGNVVDYTNRRVNELNDRTEYRLNLIQKQLSDDIKFMSQANAQNLEVIRRTVDEKLSATLEGKLGESYSLINERLEAVYKGLGEVRGLASSVGDIKKVFTNVKLRGTWGETQLDALLSQMLSPEQYEASVKLNPLSGYLVDFAVKIPSKDEETVWLPIDSKFPVEEYERLINAADACDKAAEERALKNLERAVKLQAESISEKYIQPPFTTDFAIMYLPLEGLYAELLKMPALSEFLYRKRIMACGPTNLGALLSTVQTGFKTAAIEKRSGELWQMLTTFKYEFSKFSDLLQKTQKKLQEAQDSIDSAAKKTRTITRKLSAVDGLDSPNFPSIEDGE